MIEVLSEHWGSISLGLLIVVNLLNKLTVSFSEKKPGLAKAILLVTELLSVLSSKGAPKSWKLPGKTR